MSFPGFDLPAGWGQVVLFGLDRVHDLGRALERLGRSHPLVVCSWRRRRSDEYGHIAGGLGRTPPVFQGVEQHVPGGVVDAAWQEVETARADAVVSFGGGSAIDLGKALVNRAADAGWVLASVAVPTTYSGAAATDTFWVSEGQEKRLGGGASPDVVVLDPVLTLSLPWKPTASTAVVALAHCWEALSSGTGPLELAEAAARHVLRTVPAVVARPSDVMGRTDLLAASYAAGVVHSEAGGGLHESLCQGLGARAGVPHGVANAILLPHSIRGGPETPALDEPIEQFVKGLGLPKRLREAGVFEQDLDPVAAWAAVHAGASVEAALAALRQAW